VSRVRADVSRWGAIAAAFLLIACEAPDPGADGASYPSRPIEIVSWASPGGPTDVLSRSLARVGSPYFGDQRINVVNRQGGAGAATMQYLSGRAGDPHVLAVFTASGAVNMATGRIPFGPGDVTPLLRVQMDPFLIAVVDESPFRSLDEFFAEARSRPGELSIAGFGAASAHFLGFSRLTALAGDPDIRWIAYPGSSDAAVAALGGHTDAVHSNYNTIREHIRAGSMRVLGVALPLDALPETRTYAEQGYDVAPVHWRGVVGPPGLSAEHVSDIRGRLEALIGDPAFDEYMSEAAMEYAVMEGAPVFADWLASEVAESRSELERLGLLDSSR